MTEQRIPNLPRDKWTDDARRVFAYWGEPGAWENGSRVTMTMVLANHPKLALAYNVFGRQILLDSTLPARVREIVVLRVAWRFRAEYEWHYHVGYALKTGLTLAEIGAIGEGAEALGWTGKEAERAVLRAVDELLDRHNIGDETWACLENHFDQAQMMELVFTIGHYVMFTFALNAFGIQLEKDVDKIGFDLITNSGKAPDGRHRPGETADKPIDSLRRPGLRPGQAGG
jgi:alkylhydroperoxidase family enzyme